MFNDQRKSRRQSISYSAWVVLEDGKLHGCVLTDISETGARIDVDSSQAIPDRFMLLLASNGSARRRCDVVWREPHQVGVKFRRVPAKGGKGAPQPQYVTLDDTAKPAAPAVAAVAENG